MRLTPDEIAAIRDCTARHFGEGAVVRLFGSRLHDDLADGDIDLHITTPAASVRDVEMRFREDLGARIGYPDIDLLLLAGSERRRPIDDIAILTGRVLAGPPILVGPDPDPAARTRMTDDAYRLLVADAVEGGRKGILRLRQTLSLLSDSLPVDAGTLEGMRIEEQFRLDSLLLQYNNLFAIVQDQLVRGLLLATTGTLGSRNREDQRLRAEELGIVPKGLDFKSMAEARNSVSHQYPADPVRQAAVVNGVAAAVPLVIEAFEALAAYADAHVLRREVPGA